MSPDDILKQFKNRGVASPQPSSDEVKTPTASSTDDNIPQHPSHSMPTSPMPNAAASIGHQETMPNLDDKIVVDGRWMRKWYDEFNRRYWDGRLPTIELHTNRTARQWGRAVYAYHKSGGYCHGPLFRFAIYLSNYYASTEKVKQNVLIHEMIHIADYVFHPEHFVDDGRRVREYDAHGPIFFLKEAARLKQYGWDISAIVSAEQIQQSEMTDDVKKRLANRISSAIAAVIVLPNYKFIVKTDVNAAFALEKHVKALYGHTASRIDYYHSSDEWFNSNRSVRNYIRGWRCNTDAEFNQRATKWGFEPRPFKVWYNN